MATEIKYTVSGLRRNSDSESTLEPGGSQSLVLELGVDLSRGRVVEGARETDGVYDEKRVIILQLSCIYAAVK